MIDWVRLAFNVIWIFGASLLLANYSWRSWARKIGLNETPREVRNRLISDIVAILMIGIGLVFVADPWWRKLLWAVVAALLLVQKFLPDEPETELVSSDSDTADKRPQSNITDDPSNIDKMDVAQEE